MTKTELHLAVVRVFTLLALATSVASAYSILPNHKCIGSTTTSTSRGNKKPSSTVAIDSRREFISCATVLAAPFLIPKPSEALQSKNDKLCGTGLFEHFQEYRCTAIGNILDEGTSKDMNNKEVGLADSLMGKLGVTTDDLVFEETSDNFKPKDEQKKQGSKEKPPVKK